MTAMTMTTDDHEVDSTWPGRSPRSVTSRRRASRGTGDRPLVEREEPLGEVGHRELVGPRAGPRRPARSPGAASSSSVRSASRSASASPGGTSSASRRRATPCGTRRCRRRPARCPRPSPRAAPPRTTRRRSPGSRRWSRPRSRACLLLLGDPPEPLDARDARGRAASPGCGPSPTTQRSASRSRPANASSSTARPFRALVAADEQDRRRAAPGVTRPAARPVDVDAVGQDLAVAPERRARPGAAASSDTAVATASRRIIGRSPGRNVSYQPLRPARAEWKVPTAGMRGAHQRGVVRRRARAARAGAATSGSNVRSASMRAARDGAPGWRSARPTRCSARRVLGPTRDDAGLGRRAVARGDDAGVDAELAQRAREPEHLALHAAEQRQRVRARQHDPQATGVPSPRRDHPIPGRPRGRVERRSLGQLGCSRCQCSGATRMRSSKRCASSWVTRRDVVTDASRSARSGSAAGCCVMWRPCGRK